MLLGYSHDRRPLPHPTRDQIELPMVLDCLSDPTRLAIVYNLARHDQAATELRCGDFNGLSGKSNLAYHFAKLRAGRSDADPCRRHHAAA